VDKRITDAIQSRFLAGEGQDSIALDYGLSEGQVLGVLLDASRQMIEQIRDRWAGGELLSAIALDLDLSGEEVLGALTDGGFLFIVPPHQYQLIADRPGQASTKDQPLRPEENSGGAQTETDHAVGGESLVDDHQRLGLNLPG
jgi:hypothetical protein